MRQLSAHLPQDRLSLARGVLLYNRACGSALFADISAQAHVVTQLYALTNLQAYALVALGSLPEAQATFQQAIDIRRSPAAVGSRPI